MDFVIKVLTIMFAIGFVQVYSYTYTVQSILHTLYAELYPLRLQNDASLPEPSILEVFTQSYKGG